MSLQEGDTDDLTARRLSFNAGVSPQRIRSLWLRLTTSFGRRVVAGRGGADSVSFAGQDPILPATHRLGACIGIPIMAGAVAAVAFHRQRGGPAQDLELDLRQAVHASTRVPSGIRR